MQTFQNHVVFQSFSDLYCEEKRQEKQSSSKNSSRSSSIASGVPSAWTSSYNELSRSSTQEVSFTTLLFPTDCQATDTSPSHSS